MSDVVVDTDLLEQDAEEVWQVASEQLQAMKGALPAIATPDFSRAFGAGELANAYSRAISMLSAYLDGGSEEFLAFEERLLQSAIAYGQAHGMTVAEIARLREEIG